jgi:hypothetical protein
MNSEIGKVSASFVAPETLALDTLTAVGFFVVVGALCAVVETFCAVVETFCVVAETFCVVAETFCVVAETFCVVAETFCVVAETLAARIGADFFTAWRAELLRDAAARVDALRAVCPRPAVAGRFFFTKRLFMELTIASDLTNTQKI